MKTGWEISDALADFIRGLKIDPIHIVECGPGRSTHVLAERFPAASIISLEHDVSHAQSAVESVAGLAGVRVIFAPLSRVTGFYDLSGFSFAPIDLLLIDGPPAACDGRHGADCLFPFLALGAVVILDDTDRPREREIAAAWQASGAFEALAVGPFSAWVYRGINWPDRWPGQRRVQSAEWAERAEWRVQSAEWGCAVLHSALCILSSALRTFDAAPSNVRILPVTLDGSTDPLDFPRLWRGSPLTITGDEPSPALDSYRAELHARPVQTDGVPLVASNGAVADGFVDFVFDASQMNQQTGPEGLCARWLVLAGLDSDSLPCILRAGWVTFFHPNLSFITPLPPGAIDPIADAPAIVPPPFVSMADPRGEVGSWLYDPAIPHLKFWKVSTSPHTWVAESVATVYP